MSDLPPPTIDDRADGINLRYGRRGAGGKAAPTSLPITEAEFQATLIEYAYLRGWQVHHDRVAYDPRRGGQWRTVIEGRPGFPDLVLARRGRCLFVELKSATGRVTPDQRGWLELLRSAGLEVRVWFPKDWPEIEKALT